MADLLFSPLGPSLVLVVAGVLLRLTARLRRSSAPALGAFLALGVTLLLLIRPSASRVATLEATWWPLVVSPQRLRWALDPWNWLVLLLLVLVGQTAVLLTWSRPGWRTASFHGMTLLFLSVSAGSITSDNLLILSAAWVATDILLIARARGGTATGDSQTTGLVAAGSLLMLLAVSITSLPVATASLASAELPGETLALLLLAAALRMGIYPLHVWLAPQGSEQDLGTRWLIGGVALITGTWLLGRVYALGASYWLTDPVWPAVLSALILIGGLGAWASSGHDRLAFLSSSRAGWLWLVVALAPLGVGHRLLHWGLPAVVLGMTLDVVGRSTVAAWGWRLPLVLSVLILSAGPMTVGLPIYGWLGPLGRMEWGLLILGNGLALASVLAAWPRSAEATSPLDLTWTTIARLLMAFALAAMPAVLWGIRPDLLAEPAGLNPRASLGEVLAAESWQPWAAMVLSLNLAALLAWSTHRIARQDSDFLRWQNGLARFLLLRWSLDGLRWALAWAENVWRTALALLEGEGYLGWLALLVLLVLLVVQP